jgi:hypothetical protein
VPWPGPSGGRDQDAESRRGRESQAQRTGEALAASQAALTAADAASAALRLEVATLTERAAQSANLRAVIASMQVPQRVPAAAEAEAPTLALEPTPGSATKKPAARRRGPDQQGAA